MKRIFRLLTICSVLWCFLCAKSVSYSQQEKQGKVVFTADIQEFESLDQNEKSEAFKILNDKLDKQDFEIHKMKVELRHFRNDKIILEGDMKKQGYVNSYLYDENSRQKTFVSLLVGFLLISGGFVYLLVRSSRSKQKYLDLLRREKNQVSIQKELVSAQKEETERVLGDLTDSIRYALRIQNAVLPSEHQIKENIKSPFFVLFQPKDIVSGDFYFLDKKGDWIVAAAADCTGHGVPGGFLSMLAITMLNDIVLKSKTLQANEILNDLRERIVESMERKGILTDQNDGLDISLLLINKKTKKAQWAGANTPLIQIHAKSLILKEYKADKRPIGIYPDMGHFTNHEFPIEKGDKYYLFTDGYSDQFGGPGNKKFMKKRFKKMLVENSRLPMTEQKNNFDLSLSSWRNFDDKLTEQVDDVTIFGIEI